MILFGDKSLSQRLYDWCVWRLFEIRLFWQKSSNKSFDRRYGTDTASEVSLISAGVSPEAASRGRHYRPFWERGFRDLMTLLPVNDGRFTFVDIGSGKGKILLLASHYDFKELVGIEYAPRLHEVAKENVKVYRDDRMKGRNFRLILGDALQFRLPDGPTVCMLFNPMDEETTAKVLLNFDNDARRDDPVFVVYLNLRDVAELSYSVFEGLSNMSVIRKTRKHVVLANAAALREFRERRAGP